MHHHPAQDNALNSHRNAYGSIQSRAAGLYPIPVWIRGCDNKDRDIFLLQFLLQNSKISYTGAVDRKSGCPVRFAVQNTVYIKENIKFFSRLPFNHLSSYSSLSLPNVSVGSWFPSSPPSPPVLIFLY